MYVFIFLPIWFCIDYIFDKNLKELVKYGITSAATVVRKDCSNHERFYYQYKVNEIKYTGEEYSSRVGRRCGDLNLGETLEITYLPAEPTVSATGDMAVRQREYFFSSLIISMLICFGIIPLLERSSKQIKKFK